MFFEEDYADDGFVLILVVLSRLDFLQELACITAVLSDEACSVPNEEFSALVTELAGCDVGIVTGLVQFGEDFL